MWETAPLRLSGVILVGFQPPFSFIRELRETTVAPHLNKHCDKTSKGQWWPTWSWQTPQTQGALVGVMNSANIHAHSSVNITVIQHYHMVKIKLVFNSWFTQSRQKHSQVNVIHNRSYLAAVSFLMEGEVCLRAKLCGLYQMLIQRRG